MTVVLGLLCAMLAHALVQREAAEPVLQEKAQLVKRLHLTDLCLFTEARYTRHPAMADLNTPFQDYPLSMEHYPSGSLIGPPNHLKAGSDRHALD